MHRRHQGKARSLGRRARNIAAFDTVACRFRL